MSIEVSNRTSFIDTVWTGSTGAPSKGRIHNQTCAAILMVGAISEEDGVAEGRYRWMAALVGSSRRRTIVNNHRKKKIADDVLSRMEVVEGGGGGLMGGEWPADETSAAGAVTAPDGLAAGGT